MKLRFLGKESSPQESPTLYATDRESYLVQGWIVADHGILTELEVGDDKTIVEVPASLMSHLAKDGLNGEVGHLAPPIVLVKDDGNYIVRGTRVTDEEALAQMSIPDHETCVEIPKSAMLALLVGR